MATIYRVIYSCDQCDVFKGKRGRIESSVELYQVPENWFRYIGVEPSRIFCSEDCLYNWIRANVSQEEADRLREGVWLA